MKNQLLDFLLCITFLMSVNLNSFSQTHKDSVYISHIKSLRKLEDGVKKYFYACENGCNDFKKYCNSIKDECKKIKDSVSAEKINEKCNKQYDDSAIKIRNDIKFYKWYSDRYENKRNRITFRTPEGRIIFRYRKLKDRNLLLDTNAIKITNCCKCSCQNCKDIIPPPTPLTTGEILKQQFPKIPAGFVAYIDTSGIFLYISFLYNKAFNYELGEYILPLSIAQKINNAVDSITQMIGDKTWCKLYHWLVLGTADSVPVGNKIYKGYGNKDNCEKIISHYSVVNNCSNLVRKEMEPTSFKCNTPIKTNERLGLLRTIPISEIITTKGFQIDYIELATYPYLKGGYEYRRIEIGIMVPHVALGPNSPWSIRKLSEEDKLKVINDMHVNLNTNCLYKFYKEHIEKK